MHGTGEGPEGDVPPDPAVAGARDTGGGARDTSHDSVADPDGESTTGVDENQEFVGRIAGDDPAYAGETGAERRAQG